MGQVVPDSKRPGMWRSLKSRGAPSDMANLAWAKNAVLVTAELDLDFEDRQRRAIDPPKSQQNGGVFSASSPLVRQNGRGALG